MRVFLVLGVIGHLLRFFSFAFVAPILLALFDGDHKAVWHFGVGMLLAIGGSMALRLGYRDVRIFRRSEAMGVVAGTWLVVAHFAAVPYFLVGISPVDALFESMSGFTTTGATILAHFEYTRAFFLWRAMTQWFGGLGVIALFVVVLPRLGIAGRQLFFAEASDAAGENISPQIRESAQRLWILYSTLTLIQLLLLMATGLPPYESLVHSLTTMSAGGFSPNGESFGGYANHAAEWVTVIFMLLAGTSFTLLWKFFTSKPLAAVRDGEFLLYLGVAAFGSLAIAFVLAYEQNGFLPGFDELRLATFQVASLISSTGFASTDYNEWSDVAKALLIGIMVVGGCAGSAAGGPKVIRLLLVLKLLKTEITKVLHPRAVLPIRHGTRVIPPAILRAVFSLWVMFFVGYLAVGLVLVLLGGEFVPSFTAALACLGNIGPGFGEVGPMGNFSGLPILAKLILTFAMWIGRLEIVTVLALLHPHVWRNLQLKEHARPRVST